MVYQQKLVAVIKYKGKILREKEHNSVFLPFLADYEIFFKNLDSLDVVLDITINNNSIFTNSKTSLVIKANSCTSINNFKFTPPGDTTIEINYRFSKQDSEIISAPINEAHKIYWYHPEWCECKYCKPFRIVPKSFHTIVTDDPNLTTSITTQSISDNISFTKDYVSDSCLNSSSEVGKTDSADSNRVLDDQVTNSEFNPFVPYFEPTDQPKETNIETTTTVTHYTQLSQLEEAIHNITITIRGHNNSEQIDKPLLVNSKLQCSRCGRKNRSNVKFCPKCGAAMK